MRVYPNGWEVEDIADDEDHTIADPNSICSKDDDTSSKSSKKSKKSKRVHQNGWKVEDIADDEDHTIADPNSICSKDDDTSSKSSKKSKKSKSLLLQRSEASLNVSEFNLTEIGKEKIKLSELVKTSLKVPGQVTQKNLQNVKKLKKLNVPLSKTHQAKIKRTIAYEKVCDDIAKWDSLVQSNRTAEQLVFPLKKPDFQTQKVENIEENFISKHPVEIAVSKLLKESENKLEPEKTFTAVEEKALKAMSATEAKQRHAELMKHRALISYKEAKARHQNKIKSKRYHRLLKRERLKKVVTEFEELQKDDAEKALEKLAELDKLRILERMTLKHRNTGKWAKQQKIRSKYNPDSRAILKEDLAMGRVLREKVDYSESVLINHEGNDELGLIEETNGNINKSSTENLLSHVPVEDENFIETDKRLSKPKAPSENFTAIEPKTDDILRFRGDEQHLGLTVPDGLSFGDENLDEMSDDVMPMDEAFGNEGCIADFREEKEAAEKMNRAKGIDLFLPGWGSWGGPSIKPSRKKMRRFFIKPPAQPPKKNTLGNVIINEDKDKNASVHQVKSLPFPFTNVHQFESYIRQPVGHTWNPQSTFQNLIAPKVITKMGKIIEPIDSDDLVLKKATSKKLVRRKRKKEDQDVKAF